MKFEFCVGVTVSVGFVVRGSVCISSSSLATHALVIPTFRFGW